MWCWAAVGELMFRNYGVLTINPRRGYQWGILSELDGPCWSDCTACRISGGQLDIILATIETYPKIAAEMTILETRSIRAQDQSAPLSPLEMIKEIDAGRPVIAGILPNGRRYPPELRSTCLSSSAIAVGRTGLL